MCEPPHPLLVKFLRPYPAKTRRLALAARQRVLQEDPYATELIYDAYNAVSIVFSVTERLRDAFCHVAVYTHYINLGFNNGVQLADCHSRLKGSGRRIRHIRVSTLADLRDPELRAFIRTASANARAKNRDSHALSRHPAIVKAIYPHKRRPLP
jgi:Domain of unknown function (DU1801)